MREKEAAVSPVVGTVLLVAIAITISAVAWYVASLASQTEVTKAPVIGFQKDANDPKVTIVSSPAGELDWFTDLRPHGTCTPLLNGAPFPTSAGTPVRAGDVITCASGDTLLIASSEEQGNALLYQTTFG